MINETETTWNERVQGNSQFFFESFRSASLNSSNPVAYVMKDPEMRSRFLQIHNGRGWMRYVASYCRHQNRINMALIGISDKELQRFLETRPVNVEEPMPGMADFNSTLIPLDSIVTMHPFEDALLRASSNSK